MIHDDPSDLKPICEAKCRQFLAACQASGKLQSLGYSVILLETLREPIVQIAYWCRGRMDSLVGDPIDAAAAIQRIFKMAGLWTISAKETRQVTTWTLWSKHLDGLAFDAAPSKDGKVVDWKAPLEVWEEMHRIGRDCGLTCGADFPGGKTDRPHYEV